MTMIVLDVIGNPAPQGSKRAFVNKRTGRPIIVESSKHVATWREDVRVAAREKFDTPLTGPISVSIVFSFARPTSQNDKYGQPRKSAPLRKITRPDLDKLIRSTFDALTGIAWLDDAQVWSMSAAKLFDARPGAMIEIRRD